MQNPVDSLKAATQHLSAQTFFGTVVSNEDPEYLQRVRVRIANLHRGLTDDQLPWAISAIPTCPMGYTTGGVGGVAVPAVGSRVQCKLMDDSPYHPVYFSHAFSTDADIDSELLINYPNRYGWVDLAGNAFIVDTVNGTIDIHHVSGQEILLSSSGVTLTATAVDINSDGDLNIKAGGDLNLYSQGDINIASEGNASVAANGTYLDLQGGNAGATVVEPTASTTREAPTATTYSEKTTD